VGFWLTRSLAGYNRDESEGEGPRLLRLAKHLKFGSPGESAKHFLAFRPQAQGYVSGFFVSVGRKMILPSDLWSKYIPHSPTEGQAPPVLSLKILLEACGELKEEPETDFRCFGLPRPDVSRLSSGVTSHHVIGRAQ